MQIEQDCFEFPWTEEDFLTCLRQRTCIGMVAERDEQIHGFMIYELFKQQLHLLNFAVAPASRRQGIGAEMVAKLKHKLSQQRRNEIVLSVRESNLPAQMFFREHDFRAMGIVRGYYDDTDEDAYRLRFQLAAEQFRPRNRISEFLQGVE